MCDLSGLTLRQPVSNCLINHCIIFGMLPILLVEAVGRSIKGP